MCITPRSRVLPENQIVAQLLTRNFLLFKEPIGSLPYLYEPPPLAPVLSQMNPVHTSHSISLQSFSILRSKFLQPYFEEQLEISVFQFLLA
jgi:hypothetical protein